MKVISKAVLFCAVISFTLAGCNGDDDSGIDAKNTKDTIGTDDIDTKVTFEATIGEYRFSVPSPVQMSKMLLTSGARFDESLVNSYENASYYSTSFQKALNLGVYGADLGYLTIYGVPDKALSYLTAVQKLTDDLGISGAFSPELLTRFSDNSGIEDSLQVMVAEAYRAGNAYLQTEKRYDVIALLLTGGFVESLHFACDVASKNYDQEILNRIGNQKTSLSNLIGLLTSVNKAVKDDLIEELIYGLIDLEKEFNTIEIQYNYTKPKTVAEEKTTYITGSTTVLMTPDNLANITTIVREIRSKIIDTE